MYYLLLFAVAIGLSAALPKKVDPDPEIYMNAKQLIESKGYAYQEVDVTTEDGYILTMHRIPYGKNQAPGKRPVFLLQHGLLCSSTNWLTNLANESLGFILADAGFDVYMGNNRGNVYSKKHVSLDPKEHAFWEFSWDEMAKYDLPALVDAALNNSEADSLFYVGHSEGTMIAFAEFPKNEDLANKIKHYFALAPVATSDNVKGVFKVLGDNQYLVEKITKMLGKDEFLPNTILNKIFSDLICGSKTTNVLCGDFIFLMAGPDSGGLNNSRIPVYMSHTPAGTSMQNMYHFGQGQQSNLFQMYDYGSPEANEEKYGQTVPPIYHPENMKTNVTLFSGTNDWLADPKDVEWIREKVKTVTQGDFTLQNYSHFDFIWGMKAPYDIYPKIIDIAKSKV